MYKVDFATKKDRKKVVRSICQGMILIVLLIIILRALFSFTSYEAFNETKLADTQDTGFIAISYFGVDRQGDETLISTERLEQHLKALYDQGYVTITQQDILDYYKQGKPLPERALYLMFEDGRRDTAIFAQKIMEKYNFKATMMTYAARFSDHQDKFLDIKDLKELEDSSYWEMGSNGYRLAYINVFDKEAHYLGELSALAFNKISDQLDRNYNHYLMDFIRDEDQIPKESRTEMTKRISWDYEQLEKIYQEGLGYVPKTYVLMHANTGQFGNNDKVSAVNEQWITKLFAMNFNREGDCKNVNTTSCYDLSRMQPQAYWPTNHLLMRIKDDTQQEVKFVVGEAQRLSAWELINGAAAYQEQKIYLTSEAKGMGTLRLKQKMMTSNLHIHVRLTGNKIGSQRIYFDANEDLSQYGAVQLKDNILSILQSGKELFAIDLATIDGTDPNEAIDIRQAGNRLLDIKIVDHTITVLLDQKPIISNLAIETSGTGAIYLQAGWSENTRWSQRNLADDVYDGVFEDFYITDASDKILYEGRYTGLEQVTYKMKKGWHAVINWFIKYL